jgi:hypothetical protein
MNQLIGSTRYIFQTVTDPFAVEPPAGYRLHSWHEKTVGVSPPGILVAIVCWEREVISANALAHLPAEWIAPSLEFIKRWVLKHS